MRMYQDDTRKLIGVTVACQITCHMPLILDRFQTTISILLASASIPVTTPELWSHIVTDIKSWIRITAQSKLSLMMNSLRVWLTVSCPCDPSS